MHERAGITFPKSISWWLIELGSNPKAHVLSLNRLLPTVALRLQGWVAHEFKPVWFCRLLLFYRMLG